MTEKQQLIAMLKRAGIGHGIRDDYDTGGTAVLVENEDDGITEWIFNTRGVLLSVLSTDD